MNQTLESIALTEMPHNYHGDTDPKGALYGVGALMAVVGAYCILRYGPKCVRKCVQKVARGIKGIYDTYHEAMKDIDNINSL